MRLHVHGIRRPHHIYTVYMITALPIIFPRLSLHSNHMRLHTHGIRPLHHIYTACLLTSPPVIYSFVCLYIATIFPYMLTVFDHQTTYIQPVFSRHHWSLVVCSVCFFLRHHHIMLHAHVIRRLYNIYEACILTTPPIFFYSSAFTLSQHS